MYFLLSDSKVKKRSPWFWIRLLSRCVSKSLELLYCPREITKNLLPGNSSRYYHKYPKLTILAQQIYGLIWVLLRFDTVCSFLTTHGQRQLLRENKEEKGLWDWPLARAGVTRGVTPALFLVLDFSLPIGTDPFAYWTIMKQEDEGNLGLFTTVQQ